MKSEKKIQYQIEKLSLELNVKEIQYKTLDQISMLSKEGESLRARINSINGMIEALKWVSSDNVTNYLEHE